MTLDELHRLHASTIHLPPLLVAKVSLAAKEAGMTPSELMADILSDVFPDDGTLSREPSGKAA